MASFQDETLDDALVRLRRAAGRLLFAKRVSALLPVMVFLSGGWVLAARFAFDVNRIDALWGLLLIAVAPVWAWIFARRKLPGDETLVAWLDKRSGGSGAILTQFELGDNRWKRTAVVECQRSGAVQNLPKPVFPSVFLSSLPAGLFVTLALWLSPTPDPLTLPSGFLRGTIESLAERIEAFEISEIVEPEQIAEFTERLLEIAATLEAGGLEQAFEALDRFREDLDKLAADRAEEMAALREAAQSMHAGMSKELAKTLDEALQNPAMAALLKAALQVLEAKSLGLDLDALESSADLSGLDSAGLGAFGEALSEELAAKLTELARGQLIDRRTLEQALARRANPRSLKDLDFKHAADCASKSGGL